MEFYGARLEYIQKLIKIPKYSNLIKIYNHIPRSEALEIQRKADLLLLLSSSEEISRGVLSGKIFEYIAAGRPILCIGGRKDFEISEVLELTKTGLVFDKHEGEKLENIIYETYYGKGIYENYKPVINEILKFSRKAIARDFLTRIEDLTLKNEMSFKVNITKSEKLNKDIPTITHIITGLERGGAERFLFNLLNYGLQGPFNNRVISLMSEGYYGPLLKKNNIPLTCLNLKRGQINFEAIKKLRTDLIENTPDIIQGWINHGNLAALIAKFMSKKKSKLSWNIRLSLEMFSEMNFIDRIGIRFRSLFSKIPDLILYNSNRAFKQYREMGFFNKNDYYIPNGFDIQKWKPNESTRVKMRNVLGVSIDHKVIGYVGRGDEQKDLPNLFKAFEITKKKTFRFCFGMCRKRFKKVFN